ncbi:MAG: hypothetical protein ACRCSC_06135 [Lactococcus garvieae]
MNAGYTQEEIDLLKQECLEEGLSFVLIEDEDDDLDEEENVEMAHFQFVGKHEGKEVIYDALLSTLSLHHSSMVYEEAEKQVLKIHKDFVAPQERTDSYKENEDADLLLEELMQELEDDETVKIAEFVEKVMDFDYGIGLEVALNVEEITAEVIEDFIEKFNSDTLKLDPTLYSFKHESED